MVCRPFGALPFMVYSNLVPRTGLGSVGEDVADHGDHLAAVELDRAQTRTDRRRFGRARRRRSRARNTTSGIGRLLGEQFPDARGDLPAEQFDAAGTQLTGHVHDVVLEIEATEPE